MAYSRLINASSGGGVAGPVSSTNNDIPTFSGTGGSTLQDSGGATLTSTALTLPSGSALVYGTDTGLSRGGAAKTLAVGSITPGNASGTVSALTMQTAGWNTLTGLANGGIGLGSGHLITWASSSTNTNVNPVSG